MKLSIVTPHAVHNFGAVLQAFALFTYLREQGHEVYMQDFPPHLGKAPVGVKERVYQCLVKTGRMLHKKEIQAGDAAFASFID